MIFDFEIIKLNQIPYLFGSFLVQTFNINEDIENSKKSNEEFENR